MSMIFLNLGHYHQMFDKTSHVVVCLAVHTSVYSLSQLLYKVWWHEIQKYYLQELRQPSPSILGSMLSFYLGESQLLHISLPMSLTDSN